MVAAVVVLPPPTAMPPVLDTISLAHSVLSFLCAQRHASSRVFPPSLPLPASGDDHHHVDGSMWLPTLTYLVASGLPFLLTMYDAEEGRKTREMLESFDACVVWGPDLNPMRSLVLEETEAPALQRYARLVADGRMDAGADEPDGPLPPLELTLCNRTTGDSRYWVGVKGTRG